MRRLFGFLGARWFLTLLGTLALCALVWFAGPLFAFAGHEPLAAERPRLLTIGVLLGLWALWQILSAVGAWRRNRKLMDQLAAQPESPDPARVASDEELATLHARFEEALSVLRRADGRRRLGGLWVYQLPWYLIIGPPGCGKTMALLNSGLDFPLAEQLGQDPVQGIGGTRNCDWWFTNEAVLLDTAGRYVTQDSYEAVDSAAWSGFLDLLKRHRPRRPINGLLVAISLSDLMQQTKAERDAHARAIRQRVQEVYGQLGIRCPVYVMFMKADLVAGFSEFFADLDGEGRAQVWGTTFAFDPGETDPERSPLAALPAEHQALTRRLTARLPERLQQERNPAKRRLVFSFPRQFAALESAIQGFLSDAFAPSRFTTRPLIRGVYFSSATQMGTPIDRILGAITANVGLGSQGTAPFTGTARSFFLARLLRDLIFPEAGLTELDPRLERRRLWLNRAAYGGLAALILLAAVAWGTSYTRNRAYITAVAESTKTVEASAENLRADERDPLALLPLLDAARDIPGGWSDRHAGVPWAMGLGLYQGNKLGSQARRTYRRVLHRALLPRVILRLEDQLREAAGDPDYLYDTLRVYLMLGDEARYDPALVQQWVAADWLHNLPRAATDDQKAALNGHLDVLLAERPVPLPLELDGALIDQARSILNSAPLAQHLHQRLKDSGLGTEGADFSISAAAGSSAQLVLERPSGKPLTRGVAAMYTYDGYHDHFDNAAAALLAAAAAESWVLGPAAQIEPGTPEESRLREALRERYLQDYVEAWNALFADLDLKPPRDLTHAAEIARILADPSDSPLRRLLVAAAAETALDQPREAETDDQGNPAADKALAKASSKLGRLGRLGRQVTRYLGDDEAGQDGPPAEAPEAYVTRRFRWLHDLVQGSDAGPPPIEGLQTSLAELQLHLDSIIEDQARGGTALAAGSGGEIRQAQQAVDRLPAPVQGLLGNLVQDSAGLASGGARAQLNKIWTYDVLRFCREAIHDRYPFQRGSHRETTLHDFGKVFGPGGLLDGFFTEHLSGIVDTSGRRWRWTRSIGIPDSVLAQFQRAAVIREAYFMGGGKLPSVTFELEPTRLDARASQVILDLGGQVVNYRHGPPRAQTLQWPAPDAIGRARLVLVGVDGSRPSQTKEGAWAWYRLLDAARMRPTGQQELFQVGFSLGGLSATFDLRAVSVRNPFQMSELRGFKCPDRL